MASNSLSVKLKAKANGRRDTPDALSHRDSYPPASPGMSPGKASLRESGALGFPSDDLPVKEQAKVPWGQKEA